ncbi:MAG TPA: hypothetical protein VKK79_05765 [Candidatus Lokiarchaeia archaeon]|nr:hypothetical protein [Candidatus Lokiarchaeia archaeon]
MVSVQVDEEKIKEMAYELSQEQKSWDDFVWLFAEAELRLKPAYILGKLYKDGDESRTVDIDADAIVDQPSEDDIRQLAEEISKQGPSVQDLHWFIAERKFIYDQVKGGM